MSSPRGVGNNIQTYQAGATSQPADATSQPADKTSQPVVTTSQLAVTTSQPAVTTSQPADTTSQPAESASHDLSGGHITRTKTTSAGIGFGNFRQRAAHMELRKLRDFASDGGPTKSFSASKHFRLWFKLLAHFCDIYRFGLR